jgi:hypothetical protein
LTKKQASFNKSFGRIMTKRERETIKAPFGALLDANTMHAATNIQHPLMKQFTASQPPYSIAHNI